jgi:dCMP deaminase
MNVTQDWLLWMMGMAKLAATRSKDSTKVGALLIGKNKELLLTAFNGPPIGVEDLPERFVRPEKYLYASHAEANLVAFAARNGIKTEGMGVVVTHCPCSSCARSLIQAGISWVAIGGGVTSMNDEEFVAARAMFDEAGIKLLVGSV